MFFQIQGWQSPPGPLKSTLAWWPPTLIQNGPLRVSACPPCSITLIVWIRVNRFSCILGFSQ